MKKRYKKIIRNFICVAMCAALVGCGNSGSDSEVEKSNSEVQENDSEVQESDSEVQENNSKSDKEIELVYNVSSDDFEAIINEWSEKTGVAVTLTNPGEDLESQMKTRMASDDLPDIWLTHGWSVNRYGEYLMDLSDQDWVADIDAGLKEVITTDDGALYILPLTQSVACIMYNKDVLEEAGVDASAIRTWADFEAACQMIKENTSAAPIQTSLGNESFDAYLLEGTCPTLFTNSDIADNKADALLNGTFDWTVDGRSVFEMIAGWYNSGYFNEDFVSCKKDDICKAFANNEGAFAIYATCIPDIAAYNENVNMGILPIPAKDDNTASYIALGEGNYGCFGVWKDTKYADECKDLLNYLAQPEIAKKIVEIDGGIPAMSNIKMDADAEITSTATAYKEAQEMFADDLIYDNFFDREYLPSGMWSSMMDAIDTLLADGNPDSRIDESALLLQDSYANLVSEQK